MQRVRIGLTGLAFVFLLVLLGAAISRWGEADSVPSNAAQANAEAELQERMKAWSEKQKQAEPA